MTRRGLGKELKRLHPEARERLLDEIKVRAGAYEAFGLQYSRHLATFAVAKLQKELAS